MFKIRENLPKSLALVALAGVTGLLFNLAGGIPFYSAEVSSRAVESREALPDSAGIHLVGLEAARVLFQRGRGGVLDARSPEDFARGHIAGALNCYVYELEKFLPPVLRAFPPATPLLIYCVGADCEDSRFLAQSLSDLGYRWLYVYKGGFTEWSQEGLPVEVSAGRGAGAGTGLSLKRALDLSRYLPARFWFAADLALLLFGIWVLYLLARKEAESGTVSLAAKLAGLIFAAASLHKIAQPLQFAHIIENYRILPGLLVNPAAIVLPWIELTCGLLLICGIVREASASVLFFLSGIFILAVGFNLVRGIDFDCGCFGSGHVPPWRVLLRDVGLLGCCLAGMVKKQ